MASSLTIVWKSRRQWYGSVMTESLCDIPSAPNCSCKLKLQINTSKSAPILFYFLNFYRCSPLNGCNRVGSICWLPVSVSIALHHHQYKRRRQTFMSLFYMIYLFLFQHSAESSSSDHNKNLQSHCKESLSLWTAKCFLNQEVQLPVQPMRDRPDRWNRPSIRAVSELLMEAIKQVRHC